MNRGLRYAGKTHDGEGSPGQAGREGRKHTGGRVRSRGDGSHQRGQARSQILQAGHRHWIVEGTARRRRSSAAQEGHYQREDPEECCACLCARTWCAGTEQAVGQALACNHSCAAARGPKRSIAALTCETGALSRQEADESRSLSCGKKGRADQRTSGTLRCFTARRPYAGGASRCSRLRLRRPAARSEATTSRRLRGRHSSHAHQRRDE